MPVVIVLLRLDALALGTGPEAGYRRPALVLRLVGPGDSENTYEGHCAHD